MRSPRTGVLAAVAVVAVAALLLPGGADAEVLYTESFSNESPNWSFAKQDRGTAVKCTSACRGIPTCCIEGGDYRVLTKTINTTCHTGIKLTYIAQAASSETSDSFKVLLHIDGVTAASAVKTFTGDFPAATRTIEVTDNSSLISSLQVEFRSNTNNNGDEHILGPISVEGTPVEGMWTGFSNVSGPWSEWSAGVCGGQESRSRTVNMSRSCLAFPPCPCVGSPVAQVSTVQTRPYNPPGTWSAFGAISETWAAWAPAACDFPQSRTGLRTTTRPCNRTCQFSPACTGSPNVTMPLDESRPKADNCCPGTWSAFVPQSMWGQWSAFAPGECGFAQNRTRVRLEMRSCTTTACVNSRCLGDEQRDAKEHEERTAAENCCIVEGGWSMWQRSPQMWGMWSSICNTVQRRTRRVLDTRTCDSPAPACNGAFCLGPSNRSTATPPAEEEDAQLVCCPESYANTESTCAACTVCVTGEMEAMPCTQSTPRVCISCDPGATFATATTCAPCTECVEGEQFARAPCITTRDTECAACTSCAPGDYIATPCGGANDTVCSPCSACAAGEYVSEACGPSSDTECTPCTACPPDTFTAAPCNATADAVCAACSPAPTCGAGQFARACGGVLDAACVACVVCGEGEAEMTACSANADTLCVAASSSGGSGGGGMLAVVGGLVGALLLVALLVFAVRRRRDRDHPSDPSGVSMETLDKPGITGMYSNPAFVSPSGDTEYAALYEARRNTIQTALRSQVGMAWPAEPNDYAEVDEMSGRGGYATIQSDKPAPGLYAAVGNRQRDSTPAAGDNGEIQYAVVDTVMAPGLAATLATPAADDSDGDEDDELQYATVDAQAAVGGAATPTPAVYAQPDRRRTVRRDEPGGGPAYATPGSTGQDTETYAGFSAPGGIGGGAGDATYAGFSGPGGLAGAASGSAMYATFSGPGGLAKGGNESSTDRPLYSAVAPKGGASSSGGSGATPENPYAAVSAVHLGYARGFDPKRIGDLLPADATAIHGWFAAESLSRPKAEELLLHSESPQPGLFLVRQRAKEDKVILSVVQDARKEQVTHFRVGQGPRGVQVLDLQTERGVRFETLAELIAHYRSHPLGNRRVLLGSVMPVRDATC